MNNNHKITRASACIRWPERIGRGVRLGALGLALGTVPLALEADTPDRLPTNPALLGHPEGQDLEVKRLRNTGKGMPSLRGPFPDTVNLEFLGQLTNEELGMERLVFTGASFLSDIWGWTSPTTGDEYAIVGTSSGPSFVRITDPANPEFLGRIPTTNPNTLRNFWWDIKTFGNYAYITTEVNDAGVAIFDLNRLDVIPGPVPTDTTLAADARYSAGGYIRAHNISINEDSGYAYLTGVSKDPAVDPGFTDEGTIILDLAADPLNPVEVAQILNVDSHDAQIVNYAGSDPDHQGKEIAILFNGGDRQVGIYDVTDKGNIQTLSLTTYPGASFTHQGWLTEDHDILLVGDEGDELAGLQDPRDPHLPDTARTYIFDVGDLDSPVFIGTFDSPAASIDHNLFVKGDRVYQANYTSGVRVLDSSNVKDGVLTEIAHMDTEPRLPTNNMNHNINIFVGPWGVFPFFDSGTIAVSDGLNGLVLMRLQE